MKQPSQTDEKRRRSVLFLDKAAKLLGWLRSFVHEMERFGTESNIDDFERVLHSSLALIASIHDALIGSAELAGKLQWKAILDSLRKTDPLLYYLWKARDVEIHDALITRAEGAEAMLEVVDEAKLQPLLDGFHGVTLETVAETLLFHLFDAQNLGEFNEKIKAGYRPPQERISAAGVKLRYALNSFTFQEFSIREHGRKRVVTPPLKHGNGSIIPSAFTAVQQAYLFYSRQWIALRSEIGPNASTRSVHGAPPA